LEMLIHVGHSPDPDDAFMFYALTFGRLDTAPYRYRHHLEDIETLNRRAERGEYEVTAVSFHAYAGLTDKYLLLPHGASFGDGYGPILVAKTGPSGDPLEWLAGKRIAVPGTRTSAFLALQLFARGVTSMAERVGETPRFETEVVPFDRIIGEVARGRFDGGVLIHEGQLTYADAASGGLQKVVDLGAWWKERTGLPLPLGGNAIRKDLGVDRIGIVADHLEQSIRWGLEHRTEALGYALKYARDMGTELADQFVGMYVNDYTLDYGVWGRQAVHQFLAAGTHIGIIESKVIPEWSS
jgi:1,4-dihydroxy-6-naphthoate synthase